MPDSAAKRASQFVDIRWFDEVDSTNLRLVELTRVGADDACDTVIVADHQTRGRGRRGRTWESPPGASLLVSVVLRAPAPDLAQLTTVCAALGAADACKEVVGVRPSLKWPNDLMVDGNKVAGILAEAVTPQLVVVGLGLNVDWGDEPMPEGATSLARLAGPDEDASPARAALLASYLHHLETRSRALGVAEGRHHLLDDYRQACSTLGRAVTVDLGGGERLVGTATGITHWGSLVVTTADGAQELAAGDVLHLRSA
ncbi:MAG TPA: biotin--[acetyl-CoA-carboxylase] ligase [Acidimicrobiales bacterium]|nr:biotin--[acetyl-CoA-carboxylase] ligase [Acidimicrobiales bacterium]